MIKRTNVLKGCTIGDAESEDRLAITHLFREIAAKTEGMTALERAVWDWEFTDRGLQDRLNAPERFTTLVAEDDHGPIGLAFAANMSGTQNDSGPALDGPHFLRLNWIGVREDWRHQSVRAGSPATVADMMIRILKSRISPQHDFIDACVSDNHPVARELLERNGFVKHNGEKRVLNRGEQACVYYRYTP